MLADHLLHASCLVPIIYDSSLPAFPGSHACPHFTHDEETQKGCVALPGCLAQAVEPGLEHRPVQLENQGLLAGVLASHRAHDGTLRNRLPGHIECSSEPA